MAEASIPTALMTNASTTEKEKVEIPIINVPQLDNLYSVSHPFFTCGATIQYLRQTKTMFVMRGLPGSGKSTLVSILKQLYPQSLAVCSADHFFINEQGVYVFNRDLIGQAHNECQKKAEEACRNAVLTVIIDNTNVRLDECRPYFEKANRYGYLILVVEPRTSWKLDATILAERNSHQVPKDVIEARLRQYHPLIPFFFGLFLNEEQSNLILDCAQQFYRQALQTIPALRKDLELISRGKSISVDQYLNRANMKSAGRFLHCTMKFIGRVTDQSRKEFNEYAGNRAVAHAIGKMFRALVVGFIITPRTLAARLLLPERQSWALWAQDDNEPFSEGSAGQPSNASARPRPGARRNPPPPPPPPPTTTTTDQLNSGDDYGTAMTKSLADDDLLLVDRLENLSLESENPTSFLRPTFGFLSRAHLTCAVAPGVSAAQAGIDMVEMIRRETNALTDNRSFVESEDDRVVIRYFDAGHAMVYLREPLKIQTVFAGSFH